ncbi:MAG TPA: MFS transporter [Bryobacteraceae bacterium]|nr:MFS transporter [Bryobacteraceae bacterium]
MATGAVTLSAYAKLVRANRNFRLLWLAQIVSELGDWFYSIAIYSFLLEVTGSAKIVAFAFVLQVLPQTIVSPAAGVLNDRLSRKKIMIFSDWMRAGIVLCMTLVRTRDMVWLLYVLLFSETVLWALFEPAHNAVIPNIVCDDEELVVANTLSSTTWSFNFAIGSALGGLVAAFFGRGTVFVLNALSFVFSALLIRQMGFAEPHSETLPPVQWREFADYSPIVEGARYVFRDRRLLVTMLVKGGLGFMGTNWVLIPIFGIQIFPLHAAHLSANQEGTLGMSVLMASRGVGAILGAFAGTWFTGFSKPRLRLSILLGFVLGALGYIALAGAPSLLGACAALIIAHAGGSMIWVASTTLIQQQTEDRFRGRVFSTEFAVSMLTLSAASYAAGLSIDWGATPRVVAFATGLLVVLPAICWSYALRLWRSPQLRQV